MADVVTDLVLGTTSPLAEKLALTTPLDIDGPVAAYFVSGGVGAAYYANLPCSTIQEIARFGDVGPLFAQSLREIRAGSSSTSRSPDRPCARPCSGPRANR